MEWAQIFSPHHMSKMLVLLMKWLKVPSLQSVTLDTTLFTFVASGAVVETGESHVGYDGT